MLIGKKRKKRSIARKWKGGWWGGLTDTCYCRLWNIEKTRPLLLVCVWCWRVLMALEHNKTTTKGGALPLFWWTCVLEVDQHEPMLRSKPPTLEFIEDEMARVALRTGWNFWLSVVTDKRRAAAKQRTTVRLVVATTWIDTGWLIRLRRPSGADLDNNLLFFLLGNNHKRRREGEEGEDDDNDYGEEEKETLTLTQSSVGDWANQGNDEPRGRGSIAIPHS